jgi:hypothetical protein
LILGLLNQLSHAKMYTKIDLCGAYNLVRIWKGDKWKTTFRINSLRPFLNMLWCLLALPMHLLSLNIQWMMSSVNTWMICWFIPLMTSSFS